jgi:hypothetical protein
VQKFQEINTCIGDRRPVAVFLAALWADLASCPDLRVAFGVEFCRDQGVDATLIRAVQNLPQLPARPTALSDRHKN